MMRRELFSLALTAGALFVLGACSTVRVSTDYDRAVDFGRLRTFSWQPEPTPATGNPRLDDALLRGRIEAAVEAELIHKGFRKVPRGEADFLMGYHLALSQKLDVRVVDDYYGYATPYSMRRGPYGPAWPRGPVYSDVQVDQFEEGTLILDVADRPANRLIWRGIGQARVHPGLSPEEREERVRSAVGEILEGFPPGR